MIAKEAVQVSVTEDYQNLQQLLESIQSISSHMISDNILCCKTDSEFPTDIRTRQAQSLIVLTNALSRTINKISKIDEEQCNANN